MGLKVIIVEDELPARSELIRKLDLVDPSIYVIDEIVSVTEGIEKIPRLHADLIFCDIKLSDGLSFEIFEQIDCEIPVVFTTAFDEYAIKAFDVNSIGYLVKPIDTVELAKVITKYKRHTANYSNSIRKLFTELEDKETFIRNFLVKKGDKLLPIKIEEVAYFFAEGKYVFLSTWDGALYLCEYNLTQLKETLNPNLFYQLNRQFIVHIHAIDSMESLTKSKLRVAVCPSAKKDVVVSSEKSSDFKKWLKMPRN